MSERSEAASTESRICMIVTSCSRHRSTAKEGKGKSCARGHRNRFRAASSPEAEPGQGTNIYSAMDAATGQTTGSAPVGLALLRDDEDLAVGGGSAALPRGRARRLFRREVGDTFGRVHHHA